MHVPINRSKKRRGSCRRMRRLGYLHNDNRHGGGERASYPAQGFESLGTQQTKEFRDADGTYGADEVADYESPWLRQRSLDSAVAEDG